MTVGVTTHSARLLAFVEAHLLSDFYADGLPDRAQASQGKKLQVQTGVQRRPRPPQIWSNCLMYNATMVRHFTCTRRINRSSLHADPIGPSSATMRDTSSNQSRETVEEYHGSEGTLGPTHPQRPPRTDTVDNLHQTE